MAYANFAQVDVSGSEDEEEHLPAKIYTQRAEFLEKMSNDDLYKFFRFTRDGIMVLLYDMIIIEFN